MEWISWFLCKPVSSLFYYLTECILPTVILRHEWWATSPQNPYRVTVSGAGQCTVIWHVLFLKMSCQLDSIKNQIMLLLLSHPNLKRSLTPITRLWAAFCDFLPKGSVRPGEKAAWHRRSLTNTSSAWWWGLAPAVGSLADSMCPWCDVMRTTLNLSGLLLKTHNLGLVRKNSSRIQLEGHSTECLTGTPQNCQGHQRQERSEKPSQMRGGEGAMTVNCPGEGAGMGQDTGGKAWNPKLGMLFSQHLCANIGSLVVTGICSNVLTIQ